MKLLKTIIFISIFCGNLSAHDDIVHRWIAYQAFLLNPHYKMAAIMPSKWSDKAEYLDEFPILRSAGNADYGSYLRDYSLLTSQNHFWNPTQDKGLDTILNPLSAKNMALGLWDKMRKAYTYAVKNNDKEAERQAYLMFGEIVHLLADMSVPAHVFLIQHPPPGNDYETYCAKRYKKWNARSIADKNIDPANDLESLFYDTAFTTQEYPPVQMIDFSRPDVVDGTYFDKMKEIKDSGEDSERLERNWNFQPEEGSAIVAENLMPLAIIKTAELYGLFYETLREIEQQELGFNFWDEAYAKNQAEKITKMFDRQFAKIKGVIANF